jgi:hypothetical protein
MNSDSSVVLLESFCMGENRNFTFILKVHIFPFNLIA